ncbi:hypothetical protein GE107_06850 [Cohnella sp. CFH 77786]|uniref:hypothetical protein n=1 Tax=Cohnella sp. CFH 77786 TaxID=2662265 RepID=UPI001C60A453|nr:hypothetical protein [Cohnella sp. CFH 77786]MBW5445778.1 hypothetical protein [Cohnella sp. CFH 77786]
MKSKGELLKKLATESYLKIIYGEKPIEYFDEFVKIFIGALPILLVYPFLRE